MLLETLTSVPKDFILSEQTIMLKDTTGYAQEILATIRGTGPSRMLGNAYLVVEWNYGSGAALGFLIVLSLLSKWAKNSGDMDWLAMEYGKVSNKGKDNVGAYVIPFIENPGPEIERLLELLRSAESLLNSFIRYGELKWPGFSAGACLLIGLLLRAEDV